MSSEKVASGFNKVYNDAYNDYVFLYSHLYDDVNAYCSRPWNKWWTILKRNYFDNPWTSFSVVAATVIVVFTLIQAFYSVLSYHRPTSK
jgi:hypothetical protein